MNFKAVTLGLLFGAAAAALAFAGPNLVTNGDFTTNGGNGQLGYNTTASGWSIATPAGYVFFYNAQGGTTSGTSADNSGAPGQFGDVKLWGPGAGSNNGLTLSRDGGAFIASDPAFENSAIEQTSSGLTVGTTSPVSFDWAVGQQSGLNLPTDAGWDASIASSTFGAPYASIPARDFAGWFTPRTHFVATSVSISVPEFSTWVMMALGFAGLGYAGFRSARRKPAAIV